MEPVYGRPPEPRLQPGEQTRGRRRLFVRFKIRETGDDQFPGAPARLLEDAGVSSADDGGSRCRANLILLPDITFSLYIYIYIKECVHVPHITQLWYLELHLCTNTKVITVAVKSCIFEIAFSCQTCYHERFIYKYIFTHIPDTYIQLGLLGFSVKTSGSSSLTDVLQEQANK